jgi:DNA-binding PadR family transcriptional regulator
MVVLEPQAESSSVIKNKRNRELTTPDLVLLSLLAERPMHGYQANLELERRQVRDWAGVSRPQIYYSLEKLERLGLLRIRKDAEPAAGPDRSVFAVTANGRIALARALEREDWTTQRDRPVFLTWLALSWQARPGVVRKQIQRRKKFLASELQREEATLEDVVSEVGHPHHEAVWMLTLVIEQFKSELNWLDQVEAGLQHRAPARKPNYAPE